MSLNAYQERIAQWMRRVFLAGETIRNREERALRFLEEAVELGQALRLDEEQVHALVAYVYGRDAGEPAQEVGGVMVTLAALCNAIDVDMFDEADMEAARIERPEVIAKVQRRQAEKRERTADAGEQKPRP